MKKSVTYLAALLLSASTSFGQSVLTVKCDNSADPAKNVIVVDDQIVEYSWYTMQPAFYVAVIDPSTCWAWGTNYNGANPGNSFGNMNEGAARPRVEYYFVFAVADPLQLEGMRGMLQQIPAGHSIIVYVPTQYDYAAIEAMNPNLIQELENRWDPSVIQGNEMMILYGVAGDAASFVEETTQNAGEVVFTTTLGCEAFLSVDEQSTEQKLFVKQNGMSFTLNPDLAVSDLQITDATGKAISFTRSENTVQLQDGTSAGIYLFQATVSGKLYRTKQLLSF